MEKLNVSNFSRTLERVEKNAETLEKLAASLLCGISPDYVRLKFEEFRLYFEFKLKKADEKEEQRLIREQIREEQRVIKEYEREVAEAEKQERMFEKMLDAAREEMANAESELKDELQTKIAMLEKELEEAKQREQRAKSMAEQTRRGHVYVISNIGSFGEGVYKIGLTRRLEPMDRVKELGDASVPFSFDVHAIIYSPDAPSLESALHRKFTRNRVNAVNQRKEFFRVTLEEIEDALGDIHEGDCEFTKTILAEEYFESLRLLGAPAEAAN